MSLQIIETRTHPIYGFKYAEIAGPHRHPSWWTFEDEQVVRDRHWHPKPGDVVLDVGAAFGSYALPALSMGARVVAFSPAEFDTKLLKLNLSLNPQWWCLVERCGLYEKDGWFDPDRSLFSECTNLDPTHQWLPVTSLDKWLQARPGVDRVDWIKLDVEGAELAVLRGAEECLRRWRPKLLIECHNFHVKDMDRQVCAYVDSLGLGYRAEVHQHCDVSHAFFDPRS